jgi:DNA processing protein
MTLLEAAALATFGVRHRQLLRHLLRVLTGRSSADDEVQLPDREPDEPLIQWACRCRTPKASREELTKAARVAVATAKRQLQRAQALGISPLGLDDDRYPPLLRAIPDPPVVFWTRGSVAHLVRPSIALVGSRAATPYGLEMARQLATDLAAAGFVIVSGLARGVDSAAHAAALGVGGTTVAVLGSGVDHIYPPEHAGLAVNIQAAGVVTSEFPPGCPPCAHHFPLRNRIISGLSHGVIVVEAPERSGALITAAAAAEQGREVFVVPGPATGGRNRGGHLLIRDGARVVESAGDVIQEIGGPIKGSSPNAGALDIPGLPDRTDFTVDDVAARTGEPPSLVLARLLELELSGRIQRIGGGRFVRSQGRVLP